MNENVTNLVNAIASGDAIGTEQAFAAAMAEKLAGRLDDMRASVAQSMFNQEEQVEDLQVEEEFTEEEDLALIAEHSDDNFDADEISLSEEEVTELVEKYMGFKMLQAALKKKGAKKPGALAAWIGRKKYGKAKFQKAAGSDHKMG